jgi:biotin carboxyl carrier protein
MAKSFAGKLFKGLLTGAAVCAGVFAYQKYKESKENNSRTEEPDEFTFSTPHTDEAGNVEVKTEMPGFLMKMNVKEGDHVNQGDVIAVIGNVMDVEAPVSGTVVAVGAKEGTMVSMDDVLVTIKPE